MNRSHPVLFSLILASALAPTASATDPVVSQGIFVTPDTALANGMGRLALDGTTMLVGYYNADDGGDSKGAVYVVERQANGTWAQTGKLLPQDETYAVNFGDRVALDFDTAAVGDTSGFQGDGGVYTYQRVAGVWTQTQVINPPWGIAGGLKGVVGLSGNDLIIGGPTLHNGSKVTGGVFFYKRIGNTWSLAQGPLFPSDANSGGGMAAEVSIDGDVAVTSKGFLGRVYIYERSGGGPWAAVQILAPVNGPSDEFGQAVAVSGAWLAVGATQDDQKAQDAGAVRMFLQTAPGQWVEQQKLVAPDGAAGDRFGSALAIRGTRLVVGAESDAIGTKLSAGSAYVFELQPNGTWVKTAKLQHPSPAENDVTGQAVALSGDGGIAIASPYHVANTYGNVLMFDAQPLSSTTSTISLASGGAQVLDVQAGLSNSGSMYFVLGSATGTAPGLPLPGGKVLPLAYDVYTMLTLNLPNSAVLSNSLGSLGAGGGAQATFALPPGLDPVLVGLTLWHAFMVIGSNPKVTFVSNPIPVLLVP